MGEITIEQAVRLGVSHHQAGRLAEAEPIYRQVLAVAPQQPDALHLLGLIAHQCGHQQDAAVYVTRSLEVQPDNVGALSNLGLIRQALGQWEEARACHERALALQPDNVSALNNLSIVFLHSGRLDEARALLERAITLAPDRPDLHNNLGNVWLHANRLAEARRCYERAIDLRPDFVEAHNHLGTVFLHTRRLADARRCFERVLAAQPDDPDANGKLGSVLVQLDEWAKAQACFERALAAQPDNAELHNNLGIIFRHTDRFDEARRSLERALALQPDSHEAATNLGNVFRDVGRLDAALASYRRAIGLNPDDPASHSNLIYSLHFHPVTTRETLREECRRWNQRHAVPLRAARRPFSHAPDPERRLRVGYVSPDLREHAVSFFLAPLLAAHDHDRFKVHCYASVVRPDPVTARLRTLADVWHDVAALSDEALAGQVRADGIDILVDLSLHTAHHRLLTFARQPAPVQVSWLGAPGRTGVETIRYHLTDARVDPPDDTAHRDDPGEAVPLPDCWCCFDPPGDGDALPAGELPALSHDGRVTFASLNNFTKINEPTLRLWARVLAAVPGSRLLLRCPDGEARAWAGGILRAGGVAGPGRLECVGREPARADYLRLYQKADVALDPSPYNGMTTSCDALWMGVPVVTLPGELPCSRASLSLLTALGLEELSARDEDDFVRLAAGLASDLPRLAAWRAGLRERMRGSALMDAPRFARHVESAYRTLWRRWCAEHTENR